MHVEKKIHKSLIQYVQNHFHYKYVVQENHIMGWWCNG
jgi:hypothetical protein